MIHLHNHSFYSYKETFNSVDAIIEKSKELESNIFSIADSDSVSSFFNALTKARINEMKMMPSYEARLKPPKELSKDKALVDLKLIKGYTSRAKVDQRMKDNLELFGIHAEIGDASDELTKEIIDKTNELSDLTKNKIRLETGQLKDSKMPFLTDHFKILFLAKNKIGLNNLMHIFSYESENEDGKRETMMPSFDDLKTITRKEEVGKKLNYKGKEIGEFDYLQFNVFEGIDIMTGFDGSEVSWYLERGNYEKAKELILNYSEQARTWLVLEGHGTERDKKVNKLLIQLEEEFGDNVKIIAANNTYYANKDQRSEFLAYNGVFQGIASGEHIKNNQHMMSRDEMRQFLADVEVPKDKIEESIGNIYDLAMEVELMVFPKGEPMVDMMDELRAAAQKGLDETYPKIDERDGTNITKEEAQERLDFELKTIGEMGFSEYFIRTKTITDMIAHIKSTLGPARGSAGGALVSYLTGITAVDPLRYGLFFERFLNKGRGSQPIMDKKTGKQMVDYDGSLMWDYEYPDIDLDMQSEIIVDGKRVQTRNYLMDMLIKEGYFNFQGFVLSEVKISPIVLFKLFAKYYQLPFNEANKITTDNDISEMMADDKIKEYDGWLEKAVKDLGLQWEDNWEVMETAMHYLYRWRGVPYNSSIAASAAILTDYQPNLPHRYGAIYGDSHAVAENGYIKYDLLSISTLNQIEYFNKQETDWDDVFDENVWKNIAAGKTDFVFQFGSDGMKRILTGAHVDTLDKLADCNGLYRPGPIGIGMIEQYIDAYKGELHSDKEEKLLIQIMKDIYGEEHSGMIIFQEQVMKLCEECSGFSLRESDDIRRALGRKIDSLLQSYKGPFIDNFKYKEYYDFGPLGDLLGTKELVTPEGKVYTAEEAYVLIESGEVLDLELV